MVSYSKLGWPLCFVLLFSDEIPILYLFHLMLYVFIVISYLTLLKVFHPNQIVVNSHFVSILSIHRVRSFFIELYTPRIKIGSSRNV